jgi:hypothetical protein
MIDWSQDEQRDRPISGIVTSFLDKELLSNKVVE